MTSETYYKLAKVFLFLPLLAGLLILIEQVLPLQTINTYIESKSVSERQKYGTKTFSIYFENFSEQFTEEIYNTVNEGDEVILQASYFDKEVKTLQIKGSNLVMKNDTSEIYFQLGIAIALFVFSVFYLRKEYYTNKQYRYILFLCLFGLASLIRIINVNI